MDRWLESCSFKRERPTDEEEVNASDVQRIKSVTLEPKLSVSIEPNSSAFLETNPSRINVQLTGKVRKYNSDYLEIGFTFTGPEQRLKPQYVICYESLSNE
ncbi:uncharacterized protein LOC126184301 [Schistocerca cancellata]|uniref:uncharacterized protein LOC126184301 n=1 Tax=Schistocerca cancellata TaxID=274614 RepID=UPI002119656D|nr:uncharacterized protein LOC126184301 [Schistocerca cancellata]